MKKLMIAAAVAFAAVASQAAAISWAQNAYQYGIAATTVSSGLKANTTYTADTTKAKSQITSTYAILTLTHGTDWSETQQVSFNWSNLSRASVSSINFDNVVLTGAGDSCTYELTIYGKITDGKSTTWDVVSETLTGTFNYSAASSRLQTGAAGSWTTTPEPTSGLLLLLGVAGLALRRKQK